jgi:FlaG/FlaF family flagellin (archaellin)
MQRKQTLIIATLVIVAVAALTAGVSYALANPPVEDLTEQTGQSITYGEPTPGTMPGLNENRPENQTNDPDGPQL